MSRELMDIPREVVHRKTGLRAKVIGVDLGDTKGIVSYNDFIDNFDEYIDPKDVEIARLLAIIKDLEKPKTRATTRRLSKEERKEVRHLIEDGRDIQQVAVTYNVSASAIYHWIKQENWNYKKVRNAV